MPINIAIRASKFGAFSDRILVQNSINQNNAKQEDFFIATHKYSPHLTLILEEKANFRPV